MVKSIHSCLLFAVTLALGGCAASPLTVSTQDLPAGQTYVRKLDYRRAPEMKDLAEHAVELSNEVYPKVYALLADRPSARAGQVDIIFQPFGGKHDQTDPHAFVSGRKICLDSGYFSEFPENLDWILPHELTHAVQRYQLGVGGIQLWMKAPFWWVEGIADYARYNLGYTNDWDCPGCSAVFPHYTSGYACAGAFLLYVEATYNSNVVRLLHRELRRGSYSDHFFTQTTGRRLEDLWAEFQETPYFTPAAAQVNEERAKLGFVNGQPPRHRAARYADYLQTQPGGILTWEAIHFLKQHGKVPPNSDLLERNYFQQQPGGALMVDACAFLDHLIRQGQLPGFAKGEHGAIYRMLEPFRAVAPVVYPCSHTLNVRKNGTNSIYRYTVVRASPDSPWKLQQAWRIGAGGKVLEVYSLP